MKIKDLKQLDREELEKFTLRLFEVNLKLQKEKAELEADLEQYRQMIETIDTYFGGTQQQN
jgi:hypothetical protein